MKKFLERNKKKIVLFGSTNIAKKCLHHLIKNLNYYNIYVVTDKNYNDKDQVYQFCKKKKIKITTLEKISRSRQLFDYGFSIRFNKIFSRNIINQFRKGIINMHGGPLPYYRGTSNHIHAIINNEKTFGVSLHFVDTKIDNGKVIKVKKFAINSNDTGFTILKKTHDYGFLLFVDLIKKIKLDIKIKSYDQNTRCNVYKKKDLEKYKKVKIYKLKKKQLINLLRAFYHPKKDSFNFTGTNHKLL